MKKYIVTLTCEERTELESLIKKGRAAAHKRRHAEILLKADSTPNSPNWTDNKISDAFSVSNKTIQNVRERFVKLGFEAAINRARSTRKFNNKIDGEIEAKLIATACSDAPEGHSKWSLRLLADTLVELQVVESVSYETVRRTLKKMNLNLG